MSSHRLLRFGLIVLPIAFCALSACNKDDSVNRYEVAKTPGGTPPSEMAAPPAADSAPVATAAAPIQWTVPPGWKQLPGTQMRYASFAVAEDHPDVQLSVVRLAGTGGTLLSNINRWEGQIGLPPTAEADMNKVVTQIDVAGTPVEIFDRTGPATPDQKPANRILAAIVAHAEQTWFLKLEGPSDVVQSQKANFDGFVKSIRFDAAGAPQVAAPVAVAPVAVDPTLPITFKAPAGWQQETPAQKSMFRVVAFTVAPSDGTDNAEAVVTHVLKGSGSLLDNINRWRGQVELPPIEDPATLQTEKLTVGGEEATVWNFVNKPTGHQMILAMATHGAQWWVFKLAGPLDLVEQQRANFKAFVTSVQFKENAGE